MTELVAGNQLTLLESGREYFPALEAACDWAAAEEFRAITLITFADVAWNAPFYAARGFTVVDDITPGLAALRQKERTVGLDAVGTRVVMRREL